MKPPLTKEQVVQTLRRRANGGDAAAALALASLFLYKNLPNEADLEFTQAELDAAA